MNKQTILVVADDLLAEAVANAMPHHETLQVKSLESALEALDSVSVYAVVVGWDLPQRDGTRVIRGQGRGVVARSEDLGIRTVVTATEPPPVGFYGHWLDARTAGPGDLVDAIDGL